MEPLNLDGARSRVSELENSSNPTINEIPFSFLSRPNNKTTKLVANSGEASPMRGENRWFEYEFSEPVFLSDVDISTKDYSSHHTFEFKWTSIAGGEIEKEIGGDKDGFFRLKVNQIVKAVAFRPPRAYITKPKLNSVFLRGITSEDVEQFLKSINRIDQLKSAAISEANKAIEAAEQANTRILELGQKRDEINSQIEEDRKTSSELNSEIGRLTEQRNALATDVEGRKSETSRLQSHIDELKGSIAARNAEKVALAKQISESSQELKLLQDDINMFPTDIAGFAKEAAQNTKSYWWLSFVPIALMVVIAIILLSNAANLTTILDENSNARIVSIITTRLPFVIVSTAILGGAYKLAALLIGEIIRINRQRLNLSKVSIIATDISNASAAGIEELTSEEVYRLRASLKMDMLRDHMKQYISSDFAFSSPRKSYGGLREKRKETEQEASEATQSDN